MAQAPPAQEHADELPTKGPGGYDADTQTIFATYTDLNAAETIERLAAIEANPKSAFEAHGLYRWNRAWSDENTEQTRPSALAKPDIQR